MVICLWNKMMWNVDCDLLFTCLLGLFAVTFQADVKCEQTPITHNLGHLDAPWIAGTMHGTKECPWLIVAKPGQTIEIYLSDTTVVDDLMALESTTCPLTLVIHDHQNVEEISLCEIASDSGTSLYKSILFEIEMYVAMDTEVLDNITTDFSHFLTYKVNGCPDLEPKENSVHLRPHDGNTLKVSCLNSDQRWYITCKGNNWVGIIGDCIGPVLTTEEIVQVDVTDGIGGEPVTTEIKTEQEKTTATELFKGEEITTHLEMTTEHDVTDEEAQEHMTTEKPESTEGQEMTTEHDITAESEVTTEEEVTTEPLIGEKIATTELEITTTQDVTTEQDITSEQEITTEQEVITKKEVTTEQGVTTEHEVIIEKELTTEQQDVTTEHQEVTTEQPEATTEQEVTTEQEPPIIMIHVPQQEHKPPRQTTQQSENDPPETTEQQIITTKRMANTVEPVVRESKDSSVGASVHKTSEITLVVIISFLLSGLIVRNANT